MASKLGALKVIQQTGLKPTGSVIFFHGSGDTGQGVRDWIKFVLGKDISFPHLRVLFPTAPLRPYTPLNGELSNVWFDRLTISPDVPEHRETLESVGDEVKQLIKNEVDSGIPLNRIIVGGFSMGGALAMHVGYRFTPQVAGVFALSSFLNTESTVYKSLKNKDESRKLAPFFACHGERDELVPIAWGEQTFKSLKDFGIEGEFHSIKNTLHEIKKNEIEKLIDWITKVIPTIPPVKAPTE